MKTDAANVIVDSIERKAAERWPDDPARQRAMIAGGLRSVVEIMDHYDETPRQYAERVGLVGPED